MKFWPKDALRWYENACRMFEYPKRQYGTMMSEIIGKEDRVLDLGCGNGAASLLIAPWCKEVIALDQDEEALEQLERRMNQEEVKNVTIKHGIWTPETAVHADVVIALHVHKALRSFENLSLLYQSVNKGGFIACPAAADSGSESFAELKKELRIKPNYAQCENGCYTKGILEGLGARVKCERFTYDFGQPLDSLEEAVRFISWQLRTDEGSNEIIKKYLELYVKPWGDKYVIPMKRQCCGISFIKLNVM